MKISKSLPTFIAEQLMYSVNDIASLVSNYSPQGGKTSSQISPEVKTNADKMGNFHNVMWRDMQKGDGFLTIFKSDEKRMKVNDVNGLACVITTGMLRQLSQAYISVMIAGSRAGRLDSGDTVPSIKRVVDILRYMDELSLDAIEFSMRSLRTSPNANNHFDGRTHTFLSDRYQADSWKQHLKTDYPNYDTSSGSDFPVQVAMAEMNTA